VKLDIQTANTLGTRWLQDFCAVFKYGFAHLNTAAKNRAGKTPRNLPQKGIHTGAAFFTWRGCKRLLVSGQFE
jgi:hypothetical protein